MTKVICVNFDEGNNEGRCGGGKGYAYFTDRTDWAVGDKAVVRVRGTEKLHVVTVCKTRASAEERAAAHSGIIQKVDLAEYEERIDKAQKREEILARLEELQEEHLRTERLRALAGVSKEAAKLLKALDTL